MWQIVTKENEENNEVTSQFITHMYFLWPLTFILKK